MTPKFSNKGSSMTPKNYGLAETLKFDLMHTPDILDWVKRSDIEIVQISNF